MKKARPVGGADMPDPADAPADGPEGLAGGGAP
jgi:hypothetical protein